ASNAPPFSSAIGHLPWVLAAPLTDPPHWGDPLPVSAQDLRRQERAPRVTSGVTTPGSERPSASRMLSPARSAEAGPAPSKRLRYARDACPPAPASGGSHEPA